MKLAAFTSRNMKEIIRDPLTALFGLAFPVVLLLLLSAIQANIPVPLFEPASLAPGIAVFSLSFMTLFSSMLISKDRSGAFLARLLSTPLTPWDFIAGYALPLIPLSLVQTVFCYICAVFLGLTPSVNIVFAILLTLPAAVFYIALGLVFGSLLNEKQVGGICGALLTNLSAWLSGAWFDLDLVGGAFKKIAELLPFSHAVELGRAILAENYSAVPSHLIWVSSYAIAFALLAVISFFAKMKRD